LLFIFFFFFFFFLSKKTTLFYLSPARVEPTPKSGKNIFLSRSETNKVDN